MANYSKIILCFNIGFSFILLFCMDVFAYSVSGKLTDTLSGNGLQGAVVTIDGKNAITDANGDYTVTNVSGGAQTISSVLLNYNIPSRNINVTGDMIGQNLSGTGVNKELAVVSLAARKDTMLLCLDGCDRTGNHAWNQSHLAAGEPGTHADWYCWATAIKMMNNYYGGTITRDEVAFKVKGGGAPEGDLAHNKGATDAETTTGLTWSLNDGVVNYSATEPTEVQYKAYIDANRPIMWSTPAHWMVVSGYRYKDKKLQLRFLNVDNNGTASWRDRDAAGWGAGSSVFVPPATSNARNKSMWLDTDSDGDGVRDFDELYRWEGNFDLVSSIDDKDDDHLNDSKDIEGWLFRQGVGNFDMDGDGKRCEVDPDSDNGGVMDGDEDLDHDADADAGETNPYSPIQPDADDIPKVKISLDPVKNIDGKQFAKVGTVTVKLNFLRNDGTTGLPVYDKSAGPLSVKYTPEGGSAVELSLSAVGSLPASEWTSDFTISAGMKDGKTTFSLKNGNKNISIIEGEHFWMDAKKPIGTVSLTVSP